MIKTPKKTILVSFSGGETSAYMIQYLQNNYSDHNFIYVFANTGEENEETLLFVHRCEKFFKIKINWIEFDLINGVPGYKKITYKSAYRSHSEKAKKEKYINHPFRKMITYYGIPNKSYPHCSRELKSVCIRRFMRSLGYKNGSYDIAIGIRSDEIDRIGEHFYPLAYDNITKQHVNSFWSKMPFKLELKGYEGNCKTCWKKSDRKLVTIIRDDITKFDFFKEMELEFGNFIPLRRLNDCKKNINVNFFRKNRKVTDIYILSLTMIKNATDDSIIVNFQTNIFDDYDDYDESGGCSESCEAF